ncbi:hypothetical protein BC629DRAFT_1592674 [Irpex lacteus]|nr:hypothetical protein BC629DRAFT_1592674 [Irpex lacteus]
MSDIPSHYRTSSEDPSVPIATSPDDPPMSSAPFEPPPEIMHMIIDAVGDPYRPWLSKPTWEACSLVSPKWRGVAQEFLFRHMRIKGNMSGPCRFLQATPLVGVHVRQLRLSSVVVRIDELDVLLGSLPHLRTLTLYRVWIIDAHILEPRSLSSRRRSIESLECPSFGLEHGAPNYDQFFGLLSLFSSIEEIWMYIGINKDDVVSNPVVIDRDAIVAAAASRLRGPMVQSIKLWGQHPADFAILVVPFLCDIGAMRRLQNVNINVFSDVCLTRLNDLLCLVGGTLKSLYIHLDTYDIDPAPGDNYLAARLCTGLSACVALNEFNISLFLENHTDTDNPSVSHEQVLARHWNMVVNIIPLIPVMRLRHLGVSLKLPIHTGLDMTWCRYNVHALSWSKMRRAVDAFPHLEYLAIWLYQQIETLMQDCVKYEMRKFRSVWVKENQEDLEIAALSPGCESHIGCKRYNKEVYRDLQKPLASTRP